MCELYFFFFFGHVSAIQNGKKCSEFWSPPQLSQVNSMKEELHSNWLWIRPLSLERVKCSLDLLLILIETR